MFKRIHRPRPGLLACFIALAAIMQTTTARAADVQTITVAGGCFWCVESDFESVPGVIEAVSGYTGGSIANPTYKQVSKGGSGHYEAVKIKFDADKVSVADLYAKFFRSVDPTDAGGQFCDRGESYRTAIFVSNNAQKSLATQAKADAQAALGRNIVTPILSAKRFYKAEAVHQDYYKGTKIVITRFGPKKMSEAYKAYRKACGRDAKVKQLWGGQAAFIN